jgi:class 3 adenylate cyclase
MASILLVDDEASARRTLALLLRKRGHRVREADGLVSAVATLDREAFDVVLTDLRMPDGGGLDVLRAARARRPDAAVILLTAYAGWESAKEAMRLGAVDYCEKGGAPEDVLARVETALIGPWRVVPATEEPGLAGVLTSDDAVQGRRTLLTVLFADLRSSLELLAGENLESARAVLDAVLERLMGAVHHHGGTVNQVMGDGIMALFGAPVALDDHALRACAAAVAMQDAITRYAVALRRGRGLDVQIRVGLASGEVIVRSVGSDLRRDYSAVGLTTHVAARLEQAARPGTILMTAGTRHLAGETVRAMPRGRIAIKGLPEAVEIYELLGLAPHGAAGPSAAGLREDEEVLT